MSRPLLLGHRGARALKSIPENSLESFDRALADGCDGFEFDVRLTADRQAIACHDPKFRGVEIASAPRASLEPLPRLEDVLARYSERAFFDIELKVPGLEAITIELVRKYPPRRGFVISSFLPEVLQAVRGNVPLGLICETKAELGRWKELPITYVIIHYKLASRLLIEEVHAAGKKVLVWTVNGARAMKKFAADGVDGIISDETALLARTVRA